MKRPLAVLEHLGAVLQDQHGGAADRADVDRLEGSIEDQHPAGRATALLRPTGARQRAHRAVVPSHPPRLRAGVPRVPPRSGQSSQTVCSVRRSRWGRSRAPGSPPPAPGAPSRASLTGGRVRRALQIGEEHVVAEAHPARPRLDPGQVHAAVRELAQDLHQPARRFVAGAPEDDRGLGVPARVHGLAGGGEPHEAGHVVRAVLHVLGEHPAVVQLGGQAGAERGRAAVSRLTVSTASAVEGAVTRSAPGRRSRRKRAHWALAWGWDTTRVTSSSARSVAGHQAVVDRVHHLGGDAHVGRRRPRARRAWRPRRPRARSRSAPRRGPRVPSWTAMTVS